MNRILIVGPDSASNQRLCQLSAADGYSATLLGERQAVSSEVLQRRDIAAILCDSAWALEILHKPRMSPLLVFDRNPNLAAAVALMKAGAADYLPGTESSLAAALTQALHEHAPLSGGIRFPIIGDCLPMRKLIRNIAKVAPTDSPVVISGESGSGKELIARALHAASNRRLAPLISANCATIPASHIEAEIFGHDQSGEPVNRGLLEAADGGTLFLDEIGDLPKSCQVRLLSRMEAGMDVRLITASHQDLSQLVKTDHFRSDLFYRLNVVALRVPPLRERGGDILLLAEAALRRTEVRLGKPDLAFAADAKAVLGAYHWPGNVRELENAVERAVILSESALINAELLAIEPTRPKAPEITANPPDQTIEDYFVNFVAAHQDQMTETELAEKLGISRKSLWERRQRLNIPRKKTVKRGRRRDIT